MIVIEQIPAINSTGASPGTERTVARQMKLIWVAVGDQDFALNGSKAIDETLTKHGIPHTFKVNEGYRHEWRLWRPHLYEFAQLLFRENRGAPTSQRR